MRFALLLLTCVLSSAAAHAGDAAALPAASPSASPSTVAAPTASQTAAPIAAPIAGPPTAKAGTPPQVAAAPVVPPAAPVAVPPPDIIPYLDRIIEWNRSLGSAEELMDRPREAVLGDKLHQDAQNVVQQSFDYARAEAAAEKSMEAGKPSDNSATPGRREQLLKIAAEANGRVTDLQAKLAEAGQTPAQHEELAGNLKLALARQSLLAAMLGISNSENDGTLLDQVNTLARTALAGAPSKSKTPVSDTVQAKPAQGSYGIFNLSQLLVAASKKQSSADELLRRTKGLKETTHTLIMATRDALKGALAQGDALTINSGQATDMAIYRQSIDKLVDRYKQLSNVMIPLGESNASLENVLLNLQEWKKLTIQSETGIFHQLLIRLVILIISIIIPLALSSAARRAIFRLKDFQKRKQLDLARRITLIFVVIIVILINFLTEFGSLATFAGFLTAGLAVGLQTVLVSMVAHSFYFGRYGIHVGDRIRVTDVTGEVIQMGILRLYMRELKETDKGLVPTGKIVAFPNSVMFQPSAFYKYADEDEIKT